MANLEPWKVGVAAAIALGVVGGLVFDYHRALEAELARTREMLVATQFQPRRREVERLFTLAYQSVRTIGFLPSVRAIRGGNRTDERQDVRAEGRFTREGERTVQQIYNNLAGNVGVSEVYCVVDGFRPDRGEVPFFMFDRVVLGADGGTPEPEAERTSDTPEEVESEEYAYYVKQLAEFRTNHPTFDADRLSDVPASASPILRTCDNAQYTSIASGDPANANGLLYSVPFYDDGGRFRGIVSAIFRTNVLEAMLVGVPNLIVTPQDSVAASEAGYAMPERTSQFVLVCTDRDLYVGDRRDPGIVRVARSIFSADPPSGDDYYLENVNVADVSPWVLIYRYDPDVLQLVRQRHLLLLTMKLGIVVVLIVSLVVSWFRLRTKREQVMQVETSIREIAAGGGDLTRRLDILRCDEVGMLAQSFDGLLETIHDLVLRIQRASRAVGEGAGEIARASARSSEGLAREAAATAEITGAVTELSDTVRDNARQAQSLNDCALDISGRAQASVAAVSESASMMEAVLESSKRIEAMVELIDEIAFQTNVLALNAAVEAARAGPHGLGFAVVASEVRTLAARTQEAAREVRNHVAEGAGRSREMNDLVQRSGGTLSEVATAISDLAARVNSIAAVSVEQAARIDEVRATVGRIDAAVRESSEIASANSETARALGEKADHLRDLIGQFRVNDDAIEDARAA